MAAPGFLDAYLPYILRRADQTLSEPFYGVLSRYEVGRSEWRVLAVLEELGELTVADLTAAALSPQPTVTHAVRRLVDRGLVVRTPGTVDKRQRFISITPSGSKLAKALISEARALEEQALAEAGDLSLLVDQLQNLIKVVETHAREADSSQRAEAS